MIVRLEHLINDAGGKRLLAGDSYGAFNWPLTDEQYNQVREVFNCFDDFSVTLSDDGAFVSCEIYKAPPLPEDTHVCVVKKDADGRWIWPARCVECGMLIPPDWDLNELFENTDEQDWQRQEDQMQRIRGLA